MHPVINKIISNSPHLSWMKDNCLFLTLHGSRCYGTNIETSDYDYKGFCCPPKQYFFSTQHYFEQAELKEPDTSIYSIKKFFKLASDNNPSILEVLFTDSQDHQIVHPLAENILDKKELFLSKRVKSSFGGFAYSQLNRIKGHRKYLLNPPKEPPTRKEMGLPEKTLIPQDQLLAAQSVIQKEIDRFNFDFLENLAEFQKIEIKSAMTEMISELKVSKEDIWLCQAKKIGFNDNFIFLMQREREWSGKKREWEQYQNWKKTRNIERASDEAKFGFDLKHAYHLVRLLRMCNELLSTGKMIVKRPDFEELLFIRNGGWSYEKLIEYSEEQIKIANELYKTSSVLPHSPNIKLIDELCMETIEKMIK